MKLNNKNIKIAYMAPGISLRFPGGATTHILSVLKNENFPETIAYVRDVATDTNIDNVLINSLMLGGFPFSSIISEIYALLHLITNHSEIDVIYARETILPVSLIASSLTNSPLIVEINDIRVEDQNETWQERFHYYLKKYQWK